MRTVSGHSIAQWAAALAHDDLNRIDTTIRRGLLQGHDSREIARDVIGSAQRQGRDGATEKTRQRIIALGRVSLKERDTS